MDMPAQSKQFDLRTLFYLTSLVAVGAVIFAPVIRSVKTGRLSWFGLTLLEVSVFAAGCYIAGLLRKNARKAAGETLFRASFRNQENLSWRRELFTLVGPVFFVCAHATMMFMMMSNDSRPPAIRYLVLLPQLMFLGQTGPIYFWNRALGIDRHDLEVCENGLLTTFGCWPWERFDSVRLSEFSEDSIVVVSKHSSGKSTTTHKTPAETREALLEAIQQQLAEHYDS